MAILSCSVLSIQVWDLIWRGILGRGSLPGAGGHRPGHGGQGGRVQARDHHQHHHQRHLHHRLPCLDPPRKSQHCVHSLWHQLLLPRGLRVWEKSDINSENPGIGNHVVPLLHPPVLGGDLHRGFCHRVNNVMPRINVVGEQIRWTQSVHITSYEWRSISILNIHL